MWASIQESMLLWRWLLGPFQSRVWLHARDLQEIVRVYWKRLQAGKLTWIRAVMRSVIQSTPWFFGRPLTRMSLPLGCFRTSFRKFTHLHVCALMVPFPAAASRQSGSYLDSPISRSSGQERYAMSSFNLCGVVTCGGIANIAAVYRQRWCLQHFCWITYWTERNGERCGIRVPDLHTVASSEKAGVKCNVETYLSTIFGMPL